MYFLYYPHDACLSYNALVLPIQQPSVSLLTNNRHGFINNWCIYSCSMLMYCVNVQTQTDSTDNNWRRLCSILATGVIRLQKNKKKKHFFLSSTSLKNNDIGVICQSSLLAATEKTGSENVFLTKYRSLKNNVYMSPYWEGKKKKWLSATVILTHEPLSCRRVRPVWHSAIYVHGCQEGVQTLCTFDGFSRLIAVEWRDELWRHKYMWKKCVIFE